MTPASRTELLHKLQEARVALHTVKCEKPGAFYRQGVARDIDEILAREPEPQEAQIVAVPESGPFHTARNAEHELVEVVVIHDPWSRKNGDPLRRAVCRCGWSSPLNVFDENARLCHQLHADQKAEEARVTA